MQHHVISLYRVIQRHLTVFQLNIQWAFWSAFNAKVMAHHWRGDRMLPTAKVTMNAHINDDMMMSSNGNIFRVKLLWKYGKYQWASNHSNVRAIMITSSNGNIFCVTGPLCGEFFGHRWITLTKASDAELWCFLLSSSEWSWVNNREAYDLRRHRAHMTSL